MVEFRDDVDLTSAELVRLYGSVGWTSYTGDPQRLQRAVAASLRVSAHEGDRLIGLARAITDGETIGYIQDVLVDPRNQRGGVGAALMARLLARLPVRQVVLLTDDEPGQHSFYRTAGLTRSDDVKDGPLRAFVRISPTL